MTVRDLIAAFLVDKAVDLSAGVICRKHLERLRNYLRAFVAAYGDEQAETLPKKTLRAWLRANPQWKSGYTLEDACGSVITCFRWAEDEWEKVTFPRLKRPADLIPGKPVRRPISEDQFWAIMAESRRGRFHRLSRLMFRAAFFFLWRIGARTCEMRAAVFDDVDWTPGGERIILDKHKTRRKKGAAREIPLDTVLVSLIRRLYRYRRFGQQTIFVNGRGRPWTCQAFADMFRLLADRCGVPASVSAYCTRHAFTCRARANGSSSEDVADVLGNDPKTVRKHYDAWMRVQQAHLLSVVNRANGRKATT